MDEKKVGEAIIYLKVGIEINKETIASISGRFPTKSLQKEISDKETAIEALEKQLPKKPRENKIRGGWLGKQKHYTCPTCGNCLLAEMMNERQNTSCCWDCGQRLDWSE